MKIFGISKAIETGTVNNRPVPVKPDRVFGEKPPKGKAEHKPGFLRNHRKGIAKAVGVAAVVAAALGYKEAHKPKPDALINSTFRPAVCVGDQQEVLTIITLPDGSTIDLTLGDSDKPFGEVTVIGGGVRVVPTKDNDEAIDFQTPPSDADFRGVIDGYTVEITADPVEVPGIQAAMTRMAMRQTCQRIE